MPRQIATKIVRLLLELVPLDGEIFRVVVCILRINEVEMMIISVVPGWETKLKFTPAYATQRDRCMLPEGPLQLAILMLNI